MANFSDYTETNILNATLKNISFPLPGTNVYLALCTGDPGEAAIANEASGAWYARQAVATATGWAALTDSAGGKLTSNSNLIAYNPVTGSGITITHLAIVDNVSGGNVLYWAPLASSKVLQIGDVLQFAAASIQVVVK